MNEDEAPDKFGGYLGIGGEGEGSGALEVDEEQAGGEGGEVLDAATQEKGRERERERC